MDRCCFCVGFKLDTDHPELVFLGIFKDRVYSETPGMFERWLNETNYSLYFSYFFVLFLPLSSITFTPWTTYFSSINSFWKNTVDSNYSWLHCNFDECWWLLTWTIPSYHTKTELHNIKPELWLAADCKFFVMPSVFDMSVTLEDVKRHVTLICF